MGLRPCEDKRSNQIWKFDQFDQLHLAFRYDLCLSINDDNELFMITCPITARRKLQSDATGAFRFSFANGQLTVVTEEGEAFVSTLQPENKYDALIVVPEGSPDILSFDQEFDQLPRTVAPTAAPTPDGFTQAPTTFLSQTFYIQSDFKFDDSVRSWCLQAINIRMNANLNVRPCEDRKKQKWLFDDGKLRLKEEPEFCIVNVRGKILKLGFCDDRNIAEFSFDAAKGGVLALKRSTEKFYFGFNTVTKYESVRLYTDDSTNESISLWKLEGL